MNITTKKINGRDYTGINLDIKPMELEDINKAVVKNTSMHVVDDQLFKQRITSNKKSIDFEAWGGIEAFLQNTSSGAGFGSKMQLLRRVVPWLAKATDMTALAVSELPFEITEIDAEEVTNKDGKKVKAAPFESSTDWQNKLGSIPSPEKLFYKIASSLCLGRAYCILKVADGRQVIEDLHYCAPHTVQPIITTNGLQTFSRSSEWGQSGIYYPAGTDPANKYSGEMMYFWLPDSDIEIGPAKSYPAGTAFLSSELLTSMDSSIQSISEAGFIPPTLLAAKGMPIEQERKSQEDWWNRFLRRWDKQTAKIVNAEMIDVKKVGAGMEELKGVYGELRSGAIESIGTAFGIPAALFMSDMAFASEVKPLIKTWYTSSVFIRIYRTIESTFNEQLLDRWGLKLAFKPESISAFQEDEANRSQSFYVYTKAGMKQSIAAEMLGLSLPSGIDYKDLDGDKPVEIKEPIDTNPVVEPKSLKSAQINKINLWRQVAVRNFKKEKALPLDFKCPELSREMYNEIRTKLSKAKSVIEVEKAFEVTDNKGSDIDRIERLLEMNLQAIEK